MPDQKATSLASIDISNLLDYVDSIRFSMLLPITITSFGVPIAIASMLAFPENRVLVGLLLVPWITAAFLLLRRMARIDFRSMHMLFLYCGTMALVVSPVVIAVAMGSAAGISLAIIGMAIGAYLLIPGLLGATLLRKYYEEPWQGQLYFSPLAPLQFPGVKAQYRRYRFKSSTSRGYRRKYRAVQVFLLIGSILYGTAISQAFYESTQEGIRKHDFSQWGTLFGALLFFGLPLMRRYRRNAREHAQAPAADVVKSDRRRPVVFVRSFSDEQIKVSEYRSIANLEFIDTGTKFSEVQSDGNYVRLEEVLANELWFLGPVIGIGDPREKIPTLGASRAYLSDDAWRDHIVGEMKNSAIILVIPGLSEFIQWEITTACHGGLLHHCLFVFPPEAANRRKERVAALLGCISSAVQLTEAEQDKLLSCCCFFVTGDEKHFILSRRLDESAYVIALRLYLNEYFRAGRFKL